MSSSPHLQVAANRARFMANALSLGRGLDWWSLALLLLALLGLLWLPLTQPSKIFLCASLVAACAQKLFALRVAFDEAVFRHWAKKWTENLAACGTTDESIETLAADLAAFDQALNGSSVISNAKSKVRDLDNRLRGAMGLLKKQALLFTLQVFTMVCAALAMHLPLAY